MLGGYQLSSWALVIKYRNILFFLLVFLSFAIVGAILFSIDIDFLLAYKALIRGGFLTKGAITQTILNSTPLIFTAFAFSLPYKANFWNIGGEGQLFLGGIASGWAGFALAGLPPAIHLPIVLLMGFSTGAFWGLIPTVLKTRLNINEVLTTMILNFIGMYFAIILLFGPLGGSSQMPFTEMVSPSARLPGIGKVHAGFFLSILLAVFLYILEKKTTFGFKLKALKSNPRASEIGGISPSKVTMITMIFGAGFAGLAGAIEVTGVYYYMWDQVSSNYAFIGIIVAFLARHNFIAIIPAGLFIGGLLTGGRLMAGLSGAPVTTRVLLIGLVMLMVAFSQALEKRARAETGE
jgi:simple sugar transport system permease protein